MGVIGGQGWHATMASALDWWRDAGVDVLVDDAPRDWTAREVVPDAVPGARPAPALPEPEPALPDTLDAFVAWRSSAEAPEFAWGGTLLEPLGDPAAPLMVLTDLPEPGDEEAGSLLSDGAGRLLDRMLAAIGHDRGSVYLASVCLSRPITGQIPRDLEDHLGMLARHHVALAAPKQLLMLGQAASRAILGPEAGNPRGRLHAVNRQGGQSIAVATLHPRFLLTKPAAKADCWRDLQLLMGDKP